MLSQEAQIEEIRRSDPDFKNVRQDFLLWDTIRIGENVPQNVNGWYTSFTAMLADSNEQSFFDQRQESEAGSAYTNMKKKTGLDWPMIITDLGIQFMYPDPVNADLFDGNRTESKMFTDVVPKDVSCSLYTGGGDDKILTFLPEMAPYGFGTSGQQMGSIETFSSVLSNGVPIAGNRFIFKNMAIKLPKDISTSIKINFAKPARDLLALMATVKPIIFANGEYKNEAKIRIAMRGMRDIQQVGNYRR